MTFLSTKTALAAALAASAMLAAPVLAGDQEPTVAVQYGDLDLSTPQGQRTLERRLRAAAREVCGIDGGTAAFRLPTTVSRTCYAETVRDFDREIALRTAEQRQQRG